MDVQDEKKVLSIQQKLGRLRNEIEELENKFSKSVSNKRNEEIQNMKFIHCGKFICKAFEEGDEDSVFNVFVTTDDNLTIPFCFFAKENDREFKEAVGILLNDVGYYYSNYNNFVFGDYVIPQLAEFFKSKSDFYNDFTNYEVIVNCWNKGRGVESFLHLKFDENNLPIIPDYNLLNPNGAIISCEKIPMSDNRKHY